jgi:hypothetical protein
LLKLSSFGLGSFLSSLSALILISGVGLFAAFLTCVGEERISSASGISLIRMGAVALALPISDALLFAFSVPVQISQKVQLLCL